MSNAALHRAVIRVIALNGFTEKEKTKKKKALYFFQSKIGLVSFKNSEVYLFKTGARREESSRGTSVAFLSNIYTDPSACKSFMHFPTRV